MSKKCPFRDLLGTPNAGIHQYNVLHTAAVDYFLTIAASFAVSYATQVPLTIVTVMLFLLGGLLHALAGVRTDALRYLGLGRAC